MLGLNQAKFDSAMTHVLVLIAKAMIKSSKNEQLWHTLDIGSMFRPLFELKIFTAILI